MNGSTGPTGTASDNGYCGPSGTDRAKVNAALAGTDLTSTLGPVKYTDNKHTTPSFIGQWNADGTITQVWPAQGASALKPLSGLA